jgi:hypothetical protein
MRRRANELRDIGASGYGPENDESEAWLFRMFSGPRSRYK